MLQCYIVNIRFRMSAQIRIGENNNCNTERTKNNEKCTDKMLAALVIAASTASLCAPAHAEEAYIVTEDEQGTVTITFDEPIVLSLDESCTGD